METVKNQRLDRSEYPFESNYFTVNGHQLHYIDEGRGQPILFVHGTPSWSFEYRNQIKSLSSEYRCIAMDHIGFGLSDKPSTYDYSSLNHAQSLERLILELDLYDIIFIVHDFGGPIGMSFALNYPDRIDKIVVLNSWLWSSEQEPEFKKLSKVIRSPLLPFLYRNFNLSAKYLLPRSFGKKKLPRSLLKQYTQPFQNSKQRNGTVGFAQSLLNNQAWFEELWIKKKSLKEVPFLFIWGMNDQFVPGKFLDKFMSGFDKVQAVKIESCGHFPQEEESEIVTKSIFDFIKTDSNENNPQKS